MSDKLPLCACGEFYQDHHPECPARREYERVVAMRKRDLAEYNRVSDELEQAMTVLRDIAGQSKYDELGDQAEEADFEGAYDIMIQLARSVTTKVREQALQDLADNDADLIDWGEKPPCDCCERLEGQWVQYCYCQNSGDLARAQAWCTARNLTEKNPRAEALQDLADEGEGLIDWGDSTRPSPGERQWTPIDAAKPKVGRGVLVWSPSNITTYMACWDGKRFKPWTLGETERAGITHWRPVGDPPLTEKISG